MFPFPLSAYPVVFMFINHSLSLTQQVCGCGDQNQLNAAAPSLGKGEKPQSEPCASTFSCVCFLYFSHTHYIQQLQHIDLHHTVSQLDFCIVCRFAFLFGLGIKSLFEFRFESGCPSFDRPLSHGLS